MSKDQTKFKRELKPYHIFILSCLLASLMILNSNNVNNKRVSLKLAEENGKTFSDIVKLRKLEDSESTKEICSRASDKLNEYYKTGDLAKIDLDTKPIKCEDQDKSYMKALIDLVRDYVGNDEEEPDSHENLRNLEEDIDTEKLKEYIMRIIPFAIFAVISILSIFGWIGCCIFCCCDCCCCCCCKKEGCRIPCFVFSYVFYALVVVVCIYGLTQSNKIFVGLANTECSILKFFGEVLNGEAKQSLPRWAGINGIKGLLDRIVVTITDLKDHSLTTLENGMETIKTKKSDFRGQMEEAGKTFFQDSSYANYKNVYSKDYNSKGIADYPLKDTYVLDVVKKFGKKEGEDKYTEESFLYMWNEEFSLVAGKADEYLDTAHDGFKDILGTSFKTVTDGLRDGANNLDKVTKPFTDAEKEIGDILNDYAGYIDDYGKMSVKIVFSVLMVMNIALGVLIIMIYLFSSKACADCCFIRCLFKCCTHALWNILALMMILSFLIGSILGLVGTVGGDMMSLVSYIMSEDNFNSPNPLLLDKLKDSKKYIQTCIHGDGDISKDLNLGDSLDSFDDINNVERNITMVQENFTRIKDECLTYNHILQRLQDEKNFEGTTALLSLQGENSERLPIAYNAILSKLNDKAVGNVRWSIESTSIQDCSQNLDSETSYYHPKYCKPKNKISGQSDEFKKYAEIFDDIENMVTYANDETQSDSVKKVIDTLKENYITYLDGYTNILDVFQDIIHSITDLVREYSGEGNDAFSFLNGKFIGTNLKIILKYLKYSLGIDLSTVGICLILVGCSLILSISSTILLIVIINIQLKKNMDAKNTTPIPGINEIPANNPQQIYVEPKYV